jgi:predicted GIY-YIG superfamily endonuclease
VATKWQKENPEKVKRLWKEYYEKNKTTINEKNRLRRLENLEEYRRRDRENTANNKEAVKISRKKYGNKIRKGGSTVYSLVSGDEVVYYGCSYRPKQRVKAHRKGTGDDSKKVFDSYKIIGIFYDRELALEIEHCLIEKYAPKYNVLFSGDLTRRANYNKEQQCKK